MDDRPLPALWTAMAYRLGVRGPQSGGYAALRLVAVIVGVFFYTNGTLNVKHFLPEIADRSTHRITGFTCVSLNPRHSVNIFAQLCLLPIGRSFLNHNSIGALRLWPFPSRREVPGAIVARQG